jgi:hypothetical protein
MTSYRAFPLLRALMAPGPLAPALVLFSLTANSDRQRDEGVQQTRMELTYPSVSVLDDIDEDGIPEMLVAAPRRTASASGQVWALSSRTGKSIWTVRGKGRSVQFGTAVIPVSDMDGDSIDEVLIGSWQWSIDQASVKSVFALHSGRLGRFLSEFELLSGDRCLGGMQIDDIDGDGVRDVALSTPFGVTVVSVVNGAPIFRFTGWHDTSFSVFDRVADVNGDSFSDLVIGEPGGFSGRCFVVDGRLGTLLSTVTSDLAGATGGTFGAAVSHSRQSPAGGRVFFIVTDSAILNPDVSPMIMLICANDNTQVWRHEIARGDGEAWATDVLVCNDPGWADGSPVAVVCGMTRKGIELLAISLESPNVMRQATVPVVGNVSGSSLRALADIDCDGVEDYAICALGAWEYQVNGQEDIVVVSGANMAPIQTIRPSDLRQ